MLSQKAKYALRAMLVLARQEHGQRVLAGAIAQEQHIPRKFLEQILLELSRNGLVLSHRGRGGGYQLSQPPDKITIGDIIRLTDGPLAPLACASLTGYRKCNDCEDEKRCAIRKLMRRVRDSMSDILDNATLADMTGK